MQEESWWKEISDALGQLPSYIEYNVKYNNSIVPEWLCNKFSYRVVPASDSHSTVELHDRFDEFFIANQRFNQAVWIFKIYLNINSLNKNKRRSFDRLFRLLINYTQLTQHILWNYFFFGVSFGLSFLPWSFFFSGFLSISQASLRALVPHIVIFRNLHTYSIHFYYTILLRKINRLALIFWRKIKRKNF